MFDISWSHLLMFGVAAVVLIPTKDLPAVLRTAGRYWGDAQRMARDFRGQITEVLRETEITQIKDNLAKDMQDIEKSASLSDETRKINEALTAAAATAGAQPEAAQPQADKPQAAKPTGQIIAQAGAAPAISETQAAADANGVRASLPTVPVGAAATPARAVNGRDDAETRLNEGIEIVRAGRGSVAQRAAKAWRKTAGSSDSGA